MDPAPNWLQRVLSNKFRICLLVGVHNAVFWQTAAQIHSRTVPSWLWLHHLWAKVIGGSETSSRWRWLDDITEGDVISGFSRCGFNYGVSWQEGWLGFIIYSREYGNSAEDVWACMKSLPTDFSKMHSLFTKLAPWCVCLLKMFVNLRMFSAQFGIFSKIKTISQNSTFFLCSQFGKMHKQFECADSVWA